MRIYLLGYMGSGKSTLGKPLAKRFMFDFVDLDTYIEKSEGKTITQIFEEVGEDGFREIETRALKEVSERENIVIATGGGAPLFNNNLEYMNSKGVTLYIKVNSGILTSRVANGRANRPLLRDKSIEELREYIESMLEYREQFYNRAMLIVEGKNLTVNDLEEAIRKW